MNQQGLPAFDVEAQVIGDVFCPLGVLVVVAAHDVQGGDGAELLDDVLAADVTGMDDGFAALKRRNGLDRKSVV